MRNGTDDWATLQTKQRYSRYYQACNRSGRLLQITYEKHTKCASCMLGKTTLEDYPGEKIRADRPLQKVNIDSFSSLVVSIEGYFHAVVMVDCHTG